MQERKQMTNYSLNKIISDNPNFSAIEKLILYINYLKKKHGNYV